MSTGYTACDGAECNQDVTKITGEYLNVKRQNEESFRFLFESEKPEIQQVHPQTGEVCGFSLRNIHTEKFSEFLKDWHADGRTSPVTHLRNSRAFGLELLRIAL